MPTIAIHGAAGRMGRRLIALLLDDPELTLASAVDRADHESIGADAGTLAGAPAAGVALKAPPAETADVLIDFSTPAATRAALHHCAENGSAMIIGTTGLTRPEHDEIDAAAQRIAILQAPNMSLGVNLLFALAAQVARRLGEDYDIEITETHHRFKTDAPSGTALGLADAICRATGRDTTRDLVYDRHGDDVPRQRGQIGMHALRSGDVVGRHTASFGTIGEELRLTHIATTRDVFALGALRAAKWLAGRSAGRYGMADVLGL